MKKENINILDCTFRDGGYYTNWIFDENIIFDYLELNETGVSDIVEIGLRTINSCSYLGPFAYSSYNYFNYCKKYKKIIFCTLLNWNDISNSFEKFKKLFPGIDNDFVEIVRIVVKTLDFVQLQKYILFLKEKGYKVCINIQNCEQLIPEKENEIKEKITFLNPDIFYLADTNGYLNTTQTNLLVSKVCSLTDIPIGVHFHNNQGLAYANSLVAIECGATYIDSTFTGIGRGAGNTQTEMLSYYLKNLTLNQINAISKLVTNFFLPLKKQYLWGESYFYFLSGSKNQSASLMHKLINEKKYSAKSLLKLATSSENDSISILVKNSEIEDSYEIEKPTAIIMANGDNWLIEKNEILNYLSSNNLETLHINYPNKKEVLTYIKSFCSCDPVKIINDYESYLKSNHTPLICPNDLLEELDFDKNKLNRTFYEMEIAKNNLCIDLNKCIIPSVQSLCYGLCYLYSKGHKNILLIGVQGFDETKKNYQLINCLNLINIKYPDLKITTLNKNCLGIRSKSIFEIKNI